MFFFYLFVLSHCIIYSMIIIFGLYMCSGKLQDDHLYKRSHYYFIYDYGNKLDTIHEPPQTW